MSKARELSKLPNYVLSTVAELKLAVGKEQGDKAFIGGYYADGDGGGGDFYWDAVNVEADNGGTIFQVTGTTTGRWKRIYSGSVSVKWFGAKGDGIADDTVAWQKAIQLKQPITANSNNIFALSDTLVIDRQITLNGNNCRFIPSSSFVYTQDKALIKIRTTTNTTIAEKKFGQLYNVNFGNVVIDGKGTDAIGLLCDYFIGSYIHDIHITDCNNSALQIGYENGVAYQYDAIRESTFERISTNLCGNPTLQKATLQWFTCGGEVTNSSMSTDMFFSDIRLIENKYKAMSIEHNRIFPYTIGYQYGTITTRFNNLQVDTAQANLYNCNVIEMAHTGYGISIENSFIVGCPTTASGYWGYAMIKLGNNSSYANFCETVSIINTRIQNSANGIAVLCENIGTLQLSTNDFGSVGTKRGIVIAKINPADLQSIFLDPYHSVTVHSDTNIMSQTDLFFSQKSMIESLGVYKNTSGVYTDFLTNKVWVSTGIFTSTFVVDLATYINALDIQLQFIRITVYASGGGVRSLASADMLLIDVNQSAGVKSYNILNQNASIINLNIDSPYGFGDFHGGEGYKFRVTNSVGATSISASILVEFL
jgi:hypothetical protein